MKNTTLFTALALVVSSALVTATTGEVAEEAVNNATESTTVSQEMRTFYDRDGNGAIDDKESRALEKDLKRGTIAVPRTVGTRKEALAFRAEVVATYDADENGELDEWEFLNLKWDIVEGGSTHAHQGALVADSGK